MAAQVTFEIMIIIENTIPFPLSTHTSFHLQSMHGSTKQTEGILIEQSTVSSVTRTSPLQQH